MRTATLPLTIVLSVFSTFAVAQPLSATARCPLGSEAGVVAMHFSNSSGLGRHFRMQLEHSPKDSCSAQDADAKNIDCTIDDPGIVHISLDDADSYFTIPAKAIAQITVRAGKPVQCTILSRGISN